MTLRCANFNASYYQVAIIELVVHTGTDLDLGAVQSIPVGAEIEGIGADDLEELSEDANEYYKLGAEGEEFKDYKTLGLKLDHANR